MNEQMNKRKIIAWGRTNLTQYPKMSHNKPTYLSTGRPWEKVSHNQANVEDRARVENVKMERKDKQPAFAE